jgi:hypothetical protein
MRNRAWLGVGSVTAALACLAWAAWLALDWVDYGIDSTCGNFIRRGAGEYCAHVRRGRVSAFVVLIVVAALFVAFAAHLFRRTNPTA